MEAIIMSVKIDHRVKQVPEVQSLFTKYGCCIKTRLGLHEAGDVCSDHGLIILQLAGDDKEIENFEDDLNDLDGVIAKTVRL